MSHVIRSVKLLCNTLVLMGVIPSSANGALVIDVSHEGDAVVVVASGTLNVDATQGLRGVAVNPFVWLYPSNGSFGLVGNSQSDYYNISASRWTPFGVGNYQDWLNVDGVVSTGDRIALFVGPVIGVPSGYVSGAQLFGVATFPGDYTSWGVNPGTYITVFNSGAEFDTVTVNVKPIPEPSSFLLAGLSIGCWALRNRRNSGVRTSRAIRRREASKLNSTLHPSSDALNRWM